MLLVRWDSLYQFVNHRKCFTVSEFQVATIKNLHVIILFCKTNTGPTNPERSFFDKLRLLAGAASPDDIFLDFLIRSRQNDDFMSHKAGILQQPFFEKRRRFAPHFSCEPCFHKQYVPIDITIDTSPSNGMCPFEHESCPFG